jgi:vanillate monooxygenase ferredoxin subunit
MLEMQVRRAFNETRRIRVFELVRADGGALPPFTTGSHINLELGNRQERSYSLVNSEADTSKYSIAVLRESEGRGGSVWMHDVLREGDVVRASEPENNFPLSEGGDHHILIAGGIGITPIVSMTARLAELKKDYALHYCARSREDAAFADTLSALHGDRIHFYFDGGDPSRGLQLNELLRERPTAGHVYVCGPYGLIRATREAGKHWPSGTIHFELFKGSRDELLDRSANGPFDVVLNRSGQVLRVPADKSLLDVLRNNGVVIKSLCREGVCGTCKVGLLGGIAEHRDDCLDDDQKSTAIQVCVSRAAPGQTLVLDI